VLIKAVAGGGGKGMRRVDSPDGFLEALEAAMAEARTAFGNAAVLIEKYIDTPRHIEVQVFGDGTRAVHLFERDCSLQRRHQKVIEEAPAPGMTQAVRMAMGDAAVRAAEAIGYKGAGTVEFIVDGSGPLREDGFWFMEMNTRLQVEHPVTEAITGIDLVEWQIRVAAGESLPAAQSDLAITGHAMEARLYAEDVAAGFLPATGPLRHVAFPDGIRADTGVRSGDSITPHYDPMIAKIVSHGATREIARRKLVRALETTRVAGTVTNLDFLARLASDPDFAAGQVDTGLIARKLGILQQRPAPAPRVVAEAALAVTGQLEDPSPYRGFALWQPLAQPVVLRFGDEVLDCHVTWLGPGAAEIAVPGGPVTAKRQDDGMWRLDGQALSGSVVDAASVTVFTSPAARFDRIDLLARAGHTDAGEAQTRAPMPGRVTRVAVRTGQSVAAGDALLTLEAMKMEHTLRAGRAGVIAGVLVAAGDQVEAGAPLVLLEPEEETA
jgi:3-methylcrotonyl-CoA carboxylase alpha subunit